MMPDPMFDTCNRVHYLCRLSADNDDPCLATPHCCVMTIETLKILSRKTPAVPSRINLNSANEAKWVPPQLHFITPTSEPAAKSS